MDPQLRRSSEEGSLEITCKGKSFNNLPWTRVSELIPLSSVSQKLTNKFRAEPSKPIALNFHNFGLDVSSIKSNKFSSREIQHIMNSNSNACSILKYRRRQLVTKTNYFIEMDKIDHYGRESLYSGSCMKTIGKMVFFTGNDGKFRVSKLTEGDNALFDEVPSNGIFFKDGKLGFERIYSLHTNVMDDDQNYRIAARHRHGVVLYEVTEGENVKMLQRLPSSKGFSSMCWMGEEPVTVDMIAGLDVWDVETGCRTQHLKLPGSELISCRDDIHKYFQNNVPSGTTVLQWGWSSLTPGFHPRSVLMADRRNCQVVDTRSGLGNALGLDLNSWDMVRNVDAEGIEPYCYVMTDKSLKLLDLRQPRGPVMTRATGVGVHSPAWNYARKRVDMRDWIVMGDRWGDMSVCVMDWGHETCRTWESGSHLVSLRCVDDGPPRVLGDVQHVGGWKESVIRARAHIDTWLEAPVEMRCGLGFTGYDVAEDKDGNIVLYAINALGDLFGKKLVVNEDNLDIDVDDDDDPDGAATDEVLEKWAKNVVSNSYLPEQQLNFHNYLLFQTASTRTWAIPITIKSKPWEEKHFFKDRISKFTFETTFTRRPKRKKRLSDGFRKKKRLDYYNCMSGEEAKKVVDEGSGEIVDESGKAGFLSGKDSSDVDNNAILESVPDLVSVRALNKPDRQVIKKIKQKKKGMPAVTSSTWPEELTDYIKDYNGRMLKTVNANAVHEKLFDRLLARSKFGTEVNYKEYMRCIKPENFNQINRATYSDNFLSNSSEHDNTFRYLLKNKLARSKNWTAKEINDHVLPQFHKLSIGEYADGSDSGKVNRHSSSIIKIMTGEMDERILGSGARPKTAMRKPSQESVLTSDGNQSDVPLPREEDNTFTMDAFWADLGVDIPPPQSQDNKQGYSSNQDDFDLNMDDEDDFEL